MKNQSLHWVDNARALAALAVVLIHVSAYYLLTPELLWGHLIGSGLVKIPKAGVLATLLFGALVYLGEAFYSPHSIVVVPLTLALFQVFKDSPPIPFLVKLAPASFGLYLLHPIPLKIFERQPELMSWLGVWAGIPLVFVMTVAASLILVKLTPKSLV